MKLTVRIISMAALFGLALFSIGASQMTDGHSSAMKTDSTSQPNMMGMMQNMSGQCKMMKNDLDGLEASFNKMMKINNLSDLKAEMKKHFEMMQAMQGQLTKHQSMCKNMMSMMHSEMKPGMHSGDPMGKMDMKGDGSAKPAEHSHQH